MIVQDRWSHLCRVTWNERDSVHASEGGAQARLDLRSGNPFKGVEPKHADAGAARGIVEDTQIFPLPNTDFERGRQVIISLLASHQVGGKPSGLVGTPAFNRLKRAFQELDVAATIGDIS